MTTAKKAKIAIITLVVTALALTLTTIAAINVNQNLNSSGAIATSPNLGIYSDSGCTANITSITWGSVAAGGSTTQTVYVKNTGTGTLTLNNIVAGSWNPSQASTYITVSWNQTGTPLSAGQSVAAAITLTVSSSITGVSNFYNTLTISGC